MLIRSYEKEFAEGTGFCTSSDPTLSIANEMPLSGAKKTNASGHDAAVSGKKISALGISGMLFSILGAIVSIVSSTMPFAIGVFGSWSIDVPLLYWPKAAEPEMSSRSRTLVSTFEYFDKPLYGNCWWIIIAALVCISFLVIALKANGVKNVIFSSLAFATGIFDLFLWMYLYMGIKELHTSFVRNYVGHGSCTVSSGLMFFLVGAIFILIGSGMMIINLFSGVTSSKRRSSLMPGDNFQPMYGTKLERQGFCPTCGYAVPHDSIFCMRCGTKIVKPEPIAMTNHAPNPGEDASRCS